MSVALDHDTSTSDSKTIYDEFNSGIDSDITEEFEAGIVSCTTTINHGP